MGMERKDVKIFGVIEEVLVDSTGKLLFATEEIMPHEQYFVSTSVVQEEVYQEDTVDVVDENAEADNSETTPEVSVETTEEIAGDVAQETAEETAKEIEEVAEEAIQEIAGEVEEDVSLEEQAAEGDNVSEDTIQQEQSEQQEDEVFFVYREVNEDDDPDSLAAYRRKAARILEEESVATEGAIALEWPETVVKPKPVAKTFAQKMAIADESIQDRYDQLKNYALRFKKLKARISRKFDSINKGRLQFVKLSVAGKTLKLFLNMDIELADSKFHCKDVKEKKTYVTVPVLLRIKSGRAVKYAKTLIDRCAEQHGLVENKKFREVDAMALIEQVRTPKKLRVVKNDVAATETDTTND